MHSPGSARPSVRELFHGSEEGYIPAKNAKVNKLTDHTPDGAELTQISPSAPTRDQSSTQFAHPRASSSTRDEVSVEPLAFSPSQSADSSADMADFSTPEL